MGKDREGKRPVVMGAVLMDVEDEKMVGFPHKASSRVDYTLCLTAPDDEMVAILEAFSAKR